MMTFTFFGEKLNSSAACGMESNPTKAHGATATTATIAEKELFPVGYAGCKLSRFTSGFNNAKLQELVLSQ